MPSDRIRIRRRAARGAYDRATIDAILDEALICHLGFVRDASPVVIPTIHARIGDTIYLHGSVAAGFVRDLADGRELCVTATIVDGVVLARRARNHSLNYRSVVVHSRARVVEDPDEKLRALEAVVEHIAPGRSATLPPTTDDELRDTAVLAVPIDEASAKIRTGPPVDADADLGTWAGELPLRMVAGTPVTAPGVPEAVPVPPHVRSWPEIIT